MTLPRPVLPIFTPDIIWQKWRSYSLAEVQSWPLIWLVMLGVSDRPLPHAQCALMGFARPLAVGTIHGWGQRYCVHCGYC